MEQEKLEFSTLDEFKQDLMAQDPAFEARLKAHKLQQAMVQELRNDSTRL